MEQRLVKFEDLSKGVTYNVNYVLFDGNTEDLIDTMFDDLQQYLSSIDLMFCFNEVVVDIKHNMETIFGVIMPIEHVQLFLIIYGIKDATGDTFINVYNKLFQQITILEDRNNSDSKLWDIILREGKQEGLFNNKMFRLFVEDYADRNPEAQLPNDWHGESFPQPMDITDDTEDVNYDTLNHYGGNGNKKGMFSYIWSATKFGAGISYATISGAIKGTMVGFTAAQTTNGVIGSVLPWIFNFPGLSTITNGVLTSSCMLGFGAIGAIGGAGDYALGKIISTTSVGQQYPTASKVVVYGLLTAALATTLYIGNDFIASAIIDTAPYVAIISPASGSTRESYENEMVNIVIFLRSSVGYSSVNLLNIPVKGEPINMISTINELSSTSIRNACKRWLKLPNNGDPETNNKVWELLQYKYEMDKKENPYMSSFEKWFADGSIAIQNKRTPVTDITFDQLKKIYDDTGLPLPGLKQAELQTQATNISNAVSNNLQIGLWIGFALMCGLGIMYFKYRYSLRKKENTEIAQDTQEDETFELTVEETIIKYLSENPDKLKEIITVMIKLSNKNASLFAKDIKTGLAITNEAKKHKSLLTEQLKSAFENQNVAVILNNISLQLNNNADVENISEIDKSKLAELLFELIKEEQQVVKEVIKEQRDEDKNPTDTKKRKTGGKKDDNLPILKRQSHDLRHLISKTSRTIKNKTKKRNNITKQNMEILEEKGIPQFDSNILHNTAEKHDKKIKKFNDYLFKGSRKPLSAKSKQIYNKLKKTKTD